MLELTQQSRRGHAGQFASLEIIEKLLVFRIQ